MSIFWIQKVKFAIKDVKASVYNVVISIAMDSVITNNVFTDKGLFKYKDVFVYSIMVSRTKYLKYLRGWGYYDKRYK